MDVPVRGPYKVPRSAPKLRKGGVDPATIAVHPPLELWGGASDFHQQRLHLRIAHLGESKRADWAKLVIGIYRTSYILSTNMDIFVTAFLRCMNGGYQQGLSLGMTLPLRIRRKIIRTTHFVAYSLLLHVHTKAIRLAARALLFGQRAQ